ncbi:protein FAM180A isoform X2 [Amia ocellicauda]
MYEILLRGLVIEKDNNIVLQDEELASMRQGRVFVSLINDNVPKSRVTMQRLLGRLQAERWPLEMFHFETLVLGAVYSAHQARRQKSAEEQAVWGGLLMQLVNTTLLDLRKTPQLGSNALGTY